MTIEQTADKVYEILKPYTSIEVADPEIVKAMIIQALTPPALSDYGVQLGQKVKFHRSVRKSLINGTIKGVNDDGSLLIYDSSSKFQRSLMPTDVQVQVEGPRGGKSFVQLEQPGG